jgi:hypothetical protein
MVDEYERQSEMKIGECKATRDKTLYQPFKTVAFGRSAFYDAKKTYGADVELPPKREQLKSAALIHTKPFKSSNPPKQGYNCTINKITYKEEGDPIERKKSETIKAPWKTGGMVDTAGWYSTAGIKSDFRYLL